MKNYVIACIQIQILMVSKNVYYFYSFIFPVLAKTIKYYTEPMTESELDFIKEKKEIDAPKFYRILRILGLIFITIPLLGAIMTEITKYYNRNASKELRDRIEYENPISGYVVAFFIFIIIIVVIAVVAYNRSIKKLLLDLKNKTKIIEQAEIKRKLYVKQNGTYFFYLDSPNKLSIEVSARDYELLQEGDEINIEYSFYSRIYFGYF